MDMAHKTNLRIDYAPATLRALAVDRLRAAIIAGDFASGARLVERALCDQLGVSRSVVREAIRYLEAEGLVETLPRSGPVVATMDWTRARQIYEMRRLLEAEAARACARACTPDTKLRLRHALAQIEAAVHDADPNQIYSATTQFYEVIFTSAGHDIAWEVVQRLNGRISRLRALTLASTDRSISGPAHMAKICDAICNSDPDAAALAVQAHLTEAAAIARILLDEKK
jgi:DNA-binding GntR family transcriptional regulator